MECWLSRFVWILFSEIWLYFSVFLQNYLADFFLIPGNCVKAHCVVLRWSQNREQNEMFKGTAWPANHYYNINGDITVVFPLQVLVKSVWQTNKLSTIWLHSFFSSYFSPDLIFLLLLLCCTQLIFATSMAQFHLAFYESLLKWNNDFRNSQY